MLNSFQHLKSIDVETLKQVCLWADRFRVTALNCAIITGGRQIYFRIYLIMKYCYVYILSNKSKTLYIGVTNDLQRRTNEHKHKLIDGFTKKYNLTSLVYFETFNNMQDAIHKEKQLKNLIESINPDWKDLSEDFNSDPETSMPVSRQVQGEAQ